MCNVKESSEPLPGDNCVLVFTTSAALLGVCLTVVGIIRVVITLRQVDTVADDILAAATLCFLGSCLSSYAALRARPKRRTLFTERIADLLFLLGLILMTFVTFLVTYAITGP